jgi:hypothetical protein
MAVTFKTLKLGEFNTRKYTQFGSFDPEEITILRLPSPGAGVFYCANSADKTACMADIAFPGQYKIACVTIPSQGDKMTTLVAMDIAMNKIRQALAPFGPSKPKILKGHTMIFARERVWDVQVLYESVYTVPKSALIVGDKCWQQNHVRLIAPDYEDDLWSSHGLQLTIELKNNNKSEDMLRHRVRRDVFNSIAAKTCEGCGFIMRSLVPDRVTGIATMVVNIEVMDEKNRSDSVYYSSVCKALEPAIKQKLDNSGISFVSVKLAEAAAV